MRKTQLKGKAQKFKKKSETITFALSKPDLERVYKLAGRFNDGNVSAWVRQASLKYRLEK